MLEADDWPRLSLTWRRILDEIIEQQEKDRKIDLVRGGLFRRTKETNKRLLLPLLRPRPQPHLTLNERLDEALLWYDVELIDSAESKIFSGSPALVSLMLGELVQRREHGNDDRMLVYRFKHEGNPVWFSYAVLIERSGMMSDYSGWLLFTEVGGDYGGFGGSQYRDVENVFRRHSSHVEAREFTATLPELQVFYTWKLKKSRGGPFSDFDQVSKTDEIRFRVDELESERGHLLGIVAEFCADYLFRQQGYETKLSFRNNAILPGKLEVDVIARKGKKELVIAECTMSLQPADVPAMVSEITKKEEHLLKSPEFGCETSRKLLVLPRSVKDDLARTRESANTLSRASIRILSIEDDLLPALPRRYNSFLKRAFHANRNRRPFEDTDMEDEGSV